MMWSSRYCSTTEPKWVSKEYHVTQRKTERKASRLGLIFPWRTSNGSKLHLRDALLGCGYSAAQVRVVVCVYCNSSVRTVALPLARDVHSFDTHILRFSQMVRVETASGFNSNPHSLGRHSATKHIKGHYCNLDSKCKLESSVATGGRV